MSRRENSYGRSAGFSSLRRRNILVVSGGQKSEPQYFSGLKLTRGARIRVRCKVDSPLNLVRHAEKVWNQYREEFDTAWCVVDVDNFDISSAVRLAASKNINLAVSDPCFEVWLLLHFADHCGHIADYRAARNLLARHVPGYDKKLNYAAFAPGLDDAIARAKALPPGNPSTGVWRLVEAALNR
ncbi:RloB family protein [Saccharothrix coeruleofusca]|uniref:RloB-like protein n=1 Tax=Saccharothrix coeruleofusca TaxID=33919 RepID=A0A918AKH3_9PSEU|nr:RloB family protein [Saccharothrix coeruleofusca]GGP48612.1 hypothetical protein GCM10010185_20900 [Saccharothrix coeruleofusca]